MAVRGKAATLLRNGQKLLQFMSEPTIDAKQAIELVMARKSTKPQRIIEASAALLENIQHERQYKRKELGELLNMNPDSLQFQLAMSEVNQVIECSGYHLTTAGSNGQTWKVVPLEDSIAVVKSMNRKAITLLKRSTVFACSVLQKHGDKMDEADRRRLEKQCQIQAMRYVLASRIR